VTAPRELPEPERGFTGVHPTYGGYADFGIALQMSPNQAAALLAAGAVRKSTTANQGSSLK
jgi:hypothetical protein